MFDRPDSGERAILVHVVFPQDTQTRSDIQEFSELASSAGVEALQILSVPRNLPGSRYFIGEGKLDEIALLCEQLDADLLLFNHVLTATQARNIEKKLNLRVIDRTGLILDIFAQRARTHEGKLQVELAQLEYLSTRLVRGWTHLERQKGGIGLRGPGEKQLETDRRLLRARINTIQSRLEKVRRQRAQGRRARERSQTATVSLVGYTNAGKSTLFNQLTSADVYSADQLFATLDPTMRQTSLPMVGQVVFADTVGFIKNLPHNLVDAFRATLEETRKADLLLHVIDAADPERQEHANQVDLVLAEIDAEDLPRLKVYNKTDLRAPTERVRCGQIDRDADGVPQRVWVSAITGEGIDQLKLAIAERVSEKLLRCRITLAPSQGRFRALLYESDAVEFERSDDEGLSVLQISLPESRLHHLLRKANIEQSELSMSHISSS